MRVASLVRKILWRHLAILCIVGALSACWTDYGDQGKLLSKAVANDLKIKGMYKDDEDFFKKMEIYVRYSNRVQYFIYDVKDRDFLAAYIAFVVAHGIEVTGGVPISIAVYPKASSEYVNKIFSGKRPIIEIEVNA